MVGESGLTVKPIERRTDYKLEDTAREQNAWAEGGRHTEDLEKYSGNRWIFVFEAPRIFAATGYGIVQLCFHNEEPTYGESGM